MVCAGVIWGWWFLGLRSRLEETLDARDNNTWVETEERTVEGDMAEDAVLELLLTIWVIIRLPVN